MPEELAQSVDYEALRRQVRLLMLLHSAERAGIAAIRLRFLHTYAYLSNVLAPVWNTRVFDGQLLKRRGGPFYPALQQDLDRLVGRGLVLIADIQHFEDEDGQWRLDGVFSLNHELAEDVLQTIDGTPYFNAIQSFLLEVAYAASALSESELRAVPTEDPTYSDPAVGYENIVDFAEWRNMNYSANAARHFSTVLRQATPAELLHLFVRQLHRRING